MKNEGGHCQGSDMQAHGQNTITQTTDGVEGRHNTDSGGGRNGGKAKVFKISHLMGAQGTGSKCIGDNKKSYQPSSRHGQNPSDRYSRFTFSRRPCLKLLIGWNVGHFPIRLEAQLFGCIADQYETA